MNLRFKENGIVNNENFDEIFNIYPMETKIMPDRTAWARINYLSIPEENPQNSDCFTTDEVQECLDKSNRFSLMKNVDSLKSVNNEYEFMLTYPSSEIFCPAGYEELECIEATGTQYI
jgi:hypothetical protein